MYTMGEIAANLCSGDAGTRHARHPRPLEGSPTIASTQTIFVNAALAKAYYLEQNEYAEWPADGGLYDVTVPGQHQTGLALPWGGTSHPVWFKRDPRVANVKVVGGLFDRALMEGVPQIVAAALEQIKGLSPRRSIGAGRAGVGRDERDATAREPARQHLAGFGARHRAARHVHCVLRGACNYKQTGLLQAYAAYQLVARRPRGSASRRVVRRSATASCSPVCSRSA